MDGSMREALRREIAEIRTAGLYKDERIITTCQGPVIGIQGGRRVINFCANNYLGLTSHPEVIRAAHETLERWGYGMSSVRFICGTQEIHRTAERRVAEFLGMDDAILYASCFDANLGVFEPLLGPEDAIVADRLNHASIIDGTRVCKARRYIYEHDDMSDLERKLGEASGARRKMIATDGVFSMDGDIARVDEICDLAGEHGALVMVDDSHATGFLGERGRGTHEHRGCMGRVDVITTTFGKALGGASGGCTAGPIEIVEYLRQKSRPYLFSNTVAPAVLGVTIAVVDMLSRSSNLRKRLMDNTVYFRERMTSAGFDIPAGEHPIVPIMMGGRPDDAKLAQDFARDLLEDGIYVVGFSYPVVPKGEARIRVQISAAHERWHLDQAIAAFCRIGEKRGLLA
jgi:glycine C-acetyltransferase